jgi:hypothetical protein
MEKFYEYLQSIGISNPPDAFEVVRKLSLDKIIEISIECYGLTEASAGKVTNHSIFNFSASSTMSGGTYPCAEVNCRVRNMYELAAFTALYADKVVIPNPFEHIYHRLSSGFRFDNEEQIHFFVEQLIGDIVVMLNFKPLVENKLLTINPQLRCYCKDCWKREIAGQKKIQAFLKKIEPDIIYDLNKNIKFKLDTKKSIIMSGTKDYIGMEAIRFAILPKNLKQYIKSIPYTFKSAEIKKLGLWQPIISPIFEDLVLQKYSMSLLGTTYLTNRKIEADLIQRLDNNVKVAPKEASLIRGLVQELPFIENAPLELLVRLRKQESESFVVYRESLTKVVKDITNETKAEVFKKMIKEVVSPQLQKLDQIFRNHRDEFNIRGERKVIFSSLLLTAGIFANQIAGIDIKTFLALGGAHKLAEMYGDFSEARTTPQMIKNSDYYFLWKLKKDISK